MDKVKLENTLNNLIDIFKFGIEYLDKPNYNTDEIRKNAKKILSKKTHLNKLTLPNTNIQFYDLININNETNLNQKISTKYDEFLDNFIIALNKFLDFDFTDFDDDGFSDVIRCFNHFYVKLYTLISPNTQDLFDKTIRYNEIIKNAKIVVDLQINEIENAGYLNNKFLIAKFDADTKPFTYYTKVEYLETAKEKLNKLKLNINEENISLILNNEITDEDFKAEIDASNLANIYDKIQDIKNNNYDIVKDFLFITLFNLEIQEHYIKINTIVTNNIESYKKRHNKIKEIDKITSKIVKLFQDTDKKIAEKEKQIKQHQNIFSDNENILKEMQNQNKNLDKAKFNITLLSNKLFLGQDIESGKPYDISFEEKNTKRDITTYLTIYDSKSQIINLNKEHRDINDAVGTLLDNEYRCISLKQLYNFINKGIISNDSVEEKNLNKLLNNLYKMDRKIEIDATEQFNLAGYKEYLKEYEEKTGTKARPIISQNLLNFKLYKDFPLPNGELTDIIQFMDYPAVYDYARQYRQLAPYPVEILNLNYSPKGSNNDNTIKINDITRGIRNALARCVELRKSGVNRPLVINNFLCNDCQFYDVIDKDIMDKNKIHTKVLNKQKRGRYTKNIEIILNNWVDKNYIKGYTINKQGKSPKYSISFKF